MSNTECLFFRRKILFLVKMPINAATHVRKFGDLHEVQRIISDYKSSLGIK